MISVDNITNNTCVLTCPVDEYTFYDEMSCVSDCSIYIGYYSDLSTKLCKKCDTNCKACINTKTECISCPFKYFLSSSTCLSCDGSCVECDGFAKNCTSCSEGFYMDPFTYGSCIRNCPMGYYGEDLNNSCMPCNQGCVQCLNSSFCFMCNNNYTLTNWNCMLNPSSSNGSNGSNTTNIGSNITNVSNINITNTSNRSNENNTLNNANNNKISLEVDLQKTSDISTFILSLNDSKRVLSTQDIKNFLSIDIPLLKNYLFQINQLPINQSNSFNNSFQLIFQIFAPYNQTIYPFSINFNDSSSTYSFIPNTINSLLNLQLFLKPSIDFELFFVNNQYPLNLRFIFDNKTLNYAVFPSFFIAIFNSSSIMIDSIPATSYNYSININKNQDFCIIQINFSQSIIGSNILTYTIKPNLSNNLPYNNFTLIRNSSTINLPNFYVLSQETKDLMNKTSEIIDQTMSISSKISLMNSFLNIINLMSLRVLILVDLLRFFKFLNINYPINILQLFSSGLNLGQSINTIDFQESSDDPNSEGKFYYYNVSTYFLNNANIGLLQLIGTYLLGIFFMILTKKSKFIASSLEFSLTQPVKDKCGLTLFIKCLISLIFRLIVWNFIIAQFLSTFNENMLYCFISFYWSPIYSSLGTFNFVFATCYFILLVFSFIFIFHKIHQFRKIQNLKKQNMVFPFEENPNDIEENDKKTPNFKENTPDNIPDLKNPHKNNINNTVILEDLPKNPKNNWDFSDFFDMSPGLPKFPNQPNKNISYLSTTNSPGFPVVPWHKIKELLNSDFYQEKNNNQCNQGQGDMLKNTPPDKARNIIQQVIRDIHTATSPSDILQLPKLLLKIPTRKSDVSQEETTARTRGTQQYGSIVSNSPKKSKENIETKRETVQKTLKNRYFILFKGVNNEKKGHSYFILYEMGRQTIISFLLVILWNKPLISIFIIQTINFIFLLALIIIKPYKEKKDFILSLITDIGLNIAGVVCCLLALMDKNNDYDEEKRMKLGWIFVFTNCILILLMMGIYVLQLLKFVWMIMKIGWNFYEKRKRQKVLEDKDKNNESGGKDKGFDIKEINEKSVENNPMNYSEKKGRILDKEKKQENKQKSPKSERKIPRKTINDKIKETLELNSLFMT